MKAKEEAKELTNKFLKTGMMIRQAKQCALICVDREIETLKNVLHPMQSNQTKRRIQRLINKKFVFKQEIKKI